MILSSVLSIMINRPVFNTLILCINILFYSVKGDPISDMKSQIEANILRIKMISEQNLKLESTVEKLQSIKSLYNTWNGDCINYS